MKFNLVALTALAAFAVAAPSVEREGMEIRSEEPKQVKKLTFYGWDGKKQDITDDTSIFYTDPDVVADVGKDGDKDKRFLLGWLWWNNWNHWHGKSCNYCYSCGHHNRYGGCRSGRCCASWW